jgi:polysaccharide biosynthesis transport protein
MDSGSALSPDLRSYLSVLWRRKLLILPLIIIVPTVAYFLQSQKPPLYHASADVLLSRTSLSDALAGIDDPNIFQPERDARNQVEVARAPDLAEQVVDAADVDGLTGRTFLEDSSVEPVEDTDLLRFTVASGDEDEAVELATEYADQYITYRLGLDTKALQEALAALADKLEDTTPGSSLYNAILAKQQQFETAAALQTANAVLIHPATEATQVEPRPRRAAILGLLAAIVLGLGLAFVYDALDLRVRSADEVADLLDLPLLGKLPRPSVQARRNVVMLASPESGEVEPYRILRSNLEFVTFDPPLRSVLVTSALSGEGKSTAASNLAVSFALAGKKTILVDFDLRRPSIAKLFRIAEQPGVTDVALGQATLDSALQRVPLTARVQPMPRGRNGQNRQVASNEVGSLEVLSAGSIGPAPGEFTMTDAVANLIEDLHERADILIVDSPPALQTSDALALSDKVDGILVVARLGILRRTMVRDLRRFFAAAPAVKVGVVVTGAPSDAAYGYYGVPRRSRTEAEPAVEETGAATRRKQRTVG